MLTLKSSLKEDWGKKEGRHFVEISYEKLGYCAIQKCIIGQFKKGTTYN